MKIIIAPDSYKDCRRSPEICEIISRGVKEVIPEAEIFAVPMSDGGEGTTDAAIGATGGEMKTVIVHDPLGREIEAKFGVLGNSKTAIMEMAGASGLELLSKDELNPLLTTTYGTGELIKAALDLGIEDIIIGIGGSATVDGGSGMAQALGYNLLDENAQSLVCGCSGGGIAELVDIDLSQVDPRLGQTRIRVASDVTNPLLGDNGAARVFAPQKGATSEMVEILEANLTRYSQILKEVGLVDGCQQPGDGAAGGLGFGLRAFCHAEIVSGAKLMMEITELKELLPTADLIITGEGCTDSQIASGKLCAVIAEAAKQNQVPCLLLSGALKGDQQTLREMFTMAAGISPENVSLEEAIAATEENLLSATKKAIRSFVNR